jgi:hypothetical protein
MCKGLARYFRVAGSGYNHAYGTNRTPDLLQAREGPDSKFGRQLPGSFGAKVIDSHELRCRNLREPSRVFLTVLTNPEHGYCNSLTQLYPRRKYKSETRKWKLENRKSKIEIQIQLKNTNQNSKIESSLSLLTIKTVLSVSIFQFRFSTFVFPGSSFDFPISIFRSLNPSFLRLRSPPRPLP